MVEIGAETRLYALFGTPVAHSLSPAMQTAALRALGVDAVYLAFDVARERLPDAVRAMRALRIAGANVTLPHKEAVFALLDAHTPQAVAIGAVNTLYWDGDRLVGDNTDAEGFVRSLEEAVGDFPYVERQAVLLGAGGAAQAVAFGLLWRGMRRFLLTSRGEERAHRLAERLRRAGAEAHVFPWERRDDVVRAAEPGTLVVHGTPVGMHPDVDALPLSPSALHSDLVVADLVYNPLCTRLLREAAARGARVVPGAGMFVHQGAAALERWTGRPAPVSVMRDVVYRALGAEGWAEGC
ncbi:shikimate dehydrogenase [Brockia lithotrophica]|uniref:Shikimate dehydrogenase (NADP(+)) n=1 Tax=Brockia lithotrophica TaxID=933949 RepID=A0A660L6F5_9BACL|nr:shikimate dehydrogenase [Brockia lithotrophica]RKQ88905.1 shikimate dehydrogenase [Brockia lithotrophica]